jgi:hypothetical protein
MLYSKRNRLRPERLRHDIPENARRRVVYAFERIESGDPDRLSCQRMLNQVRDYLLAEYGSLFCVPFAAASYGHEALDHFFMSDTARAIDFLEACFLVFDNPGQHGVDAINRIFVDEGIGYSLTEYKELPFDETDRPWASRRGGRTRRIQHPQLIQRDSEFSHAEVMRPALSLLSEPIYSGANDEFLQAHKHFRNGDYKACVVECLKTLESMMKTICTAKHWTFGKEPTARHLIDVCLKNGLFPRFSETQLNTLRSLLESGVPTIRNKKGAHGQGPTPDDLPPELAQYTLNLTASTALLLAGSAGL